ncbi:MAG: DUF2934 domain-containing protein [Chitinispirillaceae bacterium]|nr:DUF2934 domain-containing protein [Chitinispirillaceae bacterium]
MDEMLKEKIAKRAYELFLARGGQHGYHIQDWLQAEKEILAEMGIKKEEEKSENSSKKKTNTKTSTSSSTSTTSNKSKKKSA